MAKNFNVKPRMVGKMCKRAHLNFEDPLIGVFNASPCKKKCGWKQKCNSDEV
jgi:hypothetical protein